MHARLTRYRLKSGQMAPFLEFVERNWVPIIRVEPGFQRFEVVVLDYEEDELVAIMHFDSKEGTLDALEKAREWIFANASDFVEGVSRMVMGEVAFLVPEGADSASQGA